MSRGGTSAAAEIDAEPSWGKVCLVLMARNPIHTYSVHIMLTVRYHTIKTH